jgi:arylsulfatase A-like enzyme
VGYFLPLRERAECFVQDMIVCGAILFFLAPRARRRPVRPAWIVFVCNTAAVVDLLDIQSRASLLEPLTWGVVFGALREFDRLVGSADVFFTTDFLRHAAMCFLVLNGAPLVAQVWGWWSGHIPALARRAASRFVSAARRLGPRVGLGASVLLACLAPFLTAVPQQLDGNVFTSKLVSLARKSPKRDLARASQCDEPARVLDASELASGGDPAHALARRRNIVVFVVETFSYAESSLGGGGDTTPFLGSFAERAFLSTSARVGSAYSTKSIYAILTGRYPSPSLEIYESEAPRLDSIARTLRGAGYFTGFFTTQFLSYNRIRHQFEAMGFEQVAGAEELVERGKTRGLDIVPGTWGVRDQEFLRSGLLESLPSDRPFFAVIYNADSHYPYGPPDPARGRTDRDRYRTSLREVDAFVSDVLARLGDLGHADDTVVAILGDHGEEFVGGKLRVRGCSFGERALVVPLVVAVPGAAPIAPPPGARAIDLAPTLLDIVGVRPDSALQGRSLLVPAPRAPPAYVSSYGSCEDAAIIEGDLKVVYDGYANHSEAFAVTADGDTQTARALESAARDAYVARVQACAAYDESALKALVPAR